MNKVSLKICGITNSQSVKMAYKNKIKSLGFASNNLNGPNTATDKKIQILIKECKNYKIESVLLTRYVSLDKLIKQIDFTKPKTISCSYHFNKNELQILRKTFKRLKIGIAINPENFNMKYLKNIKKIINIIYYDMNVYKAKSIKTYALVKCLKQIQYIKSLSIPVFVGGGINENKAKEIVNLLNPDGIDVSRSLKNTKNIISSKKLKNFLEQVAVA
jgi:phosphoribosylanthranilate isomerase